MNDKISKAFSMLSLDDTASLVEVKESYRTLVKVWHPDRFVGDTKLQAQAEEQLKKINEAYSIVEEFLLQPTGSTSDPTASSSTATRTRPRRTPQPKGTTGAPSQPAGSFETYTIPCRETTLKFQTAFLYWLGESDYAPNDLISPGLALKGQLEYWPLYLYNIAYQANFSVSCGFHQMQPYTAYRTTFRNGNSYQEPYTAYRVITNWFPFANAVAGEMSLFGAGKKTVSDTSLKFISNTEVKGQTMDEGYPNDSVAMLLKPDMTPQECFDQRVSRSAASLIEQHIAGTLPGDTFTNLQYNWQYLYKHWLVYVPFWRLQFEYGASRYEAIIDGRNPQRIDGTKPEDKHRKQVASRWLLPLWITGFMSFSALMAQLVPDFRSHLLNAVTAMSLTAFVPLIFYVHWERSRFLNQARDKRLRQIQEAVAYLGRSNGK